MNWKLYSQRTFALGAVACISAGLISCGASNTVDYLYATSSVNNPGQINVYRVDSQSGALTQIPDSPYPAGRNPVSLVADGPGQNLYVANRDDNTIIQFSIGTDAKLYGQHTINLPGSEPVWVAIHSYYSGPCTPPGQPPSTPPLPTCVGQNNPSGGTFLGSLLLVAQNLQPNFTDLNPSPGALSVYQLPPKAALSGNPVVQTVNGQQQTYLPLGNAPTGANVTANGQFAYVTDILSAGQTGTGNGRCSTGQGGIQGYSTGFDTQTLPSGALNPVPSSPFCAGTAPSAVATHPFSTFLYATDRAQNQVVSYGINNQGTLTTIPTPVVAAGVAPSSIVVEPRGQYAYVANRTGGSVSGYAINQSTGALSTLATGGAAGTQAQPSCVFVEPALARFVYTANFVDGTLNGFILDPNTGGLAATQGTYYPGTGQATCVAAVSHGNHPIIQVFNSAQ